MFRKKFIFSFSLGIILLASGFYTYYHFLKPDDPKLVTSEKQTKQLPLATDKEVNEPINKRKPKKNKNKLYSVFMSYETKKSSGSSSFIPMILNPTYKLDDNVEINISSDDLDPEDDEMFIYIENYRITKKVKDQIKKIAGSKKYQAALEEIEKRVQEIKETEEYGTVNSVPLIEK